MGESSGATPCKTYATKDGMNSTAQSFLSVSMHAIQTLDISGVERHGLFPQPP